MIKDFITGGGDWAMGKGDVIKKKLYALHVLHIQMTTTS